MCIFTQTLEPYQIKLNLANLLKIKNAKLVTVNNKQKWTLKEPVCARGFHLAFPFLKVFYTNCLRNTFLIITAPRARDFVGKLRQNDQMGSHLFRMSLQTAGLHRI